MKKKHIPFRTCIACGAKKEKRELIRLSRNAKGEVVRDLDGRGVGRGAYLCDQETCLSHPKLSRFLKRAFRADAIVFENRSAERHGAAWDAL